MDPMIQVKGRGRMCGSADFRTVFKIPRRIKINKMLVLPSVLLSLAISFPLPLAGADKQVKRALDCMDFMMYEEAVSLFDQVLAKDPKQPGLRIKQAFAFYRMNKSEKAIGTLLKELEIFPDDPKALMLLSFVQYRSGRLDDAGKTARTFQDGLEKTRKKLGRYKIDTVMRDLFPNAGVPAYILALQAAKKQEAKAVRSWLIQAQERSYFPLDCWIQAIGAEIEQKNWPEALRLCQSEGDITYPEEDNRPLNAPLKPGPSPAQKKKIQLKMTADIYLLEAIIHEEQGRPSEALKCLRTAAALKPFDVNVLKNLAIALMNRDEIDEATRLLQKVVQLNPQDFQSRLFLDQAQSKRRRPDDAAKFVLSKDLSYERDVRFRYVFENDPGAIADKANLNAMELIKEGLVLEATRWLRMFVEIYENSPTIYYNLGQLYNSRSVNPEALKFGLKAMELKPDYRDAYDLVGNVCFKMRDLEDSVRLYEQAVRLEPKDPLAYYNLACACREFGDLENAEKNWLEAIRLEKAPAAPTEAPEAKPDPVKIAVRVKVETVSASACQSLGFLYGQKGMKESALAYFNKEIEFNPKIPVPYFEAGKLYFEQNDRAKAWEYFKKYLSLGGDETKVKAFPKK